MIARAGILVGLLCLGWATSGAPAHAQAARIEHEPHTQAHEAAAKAEESTFPPPNHPARTPTQPPHGAVGRDTPQSSVDRGWLPSLASVVPGVLIHGSGHFAAGAHETAGELLALEGVGLLGIGGAFVPLFVTGASRHIVGPAAALAVMGAGIFVISWLADVYGIATGDHATGIPQRVLPAFEVELGYAAVHDPLFDYSHFAVLAADLRMGRWRVTPAGWIALDDDNQRLRLEGAYRFLGPAGPSVGASRDGSYLELESAFTFHRYGPQGFEVLTWELSTGGRYDMGRLAPSLRGSFAELGLGLGFEFYGYSNASLPLGEDFAELLLARFGYGLYVGEPGKGHGGEVMVYYDHRHDTFAGGTSFDSLGDGVPGYFGVTSLYRLTRRWAVVVDLQAGSAYLGRMGLRFRPGGAS